MIEALDVSSIYDVPRAYHAAGLDHEVLAAFGIEPAPRPDMSRWNAVMERVHNPEGEVTIAIVGKYTGLKDAYKSLIEALAHGGIANRVKVKLDWIESEIFENQDPSPWLEHVHGILVPGGFGERGSEGKIAAARFARERKVPYFGICFGMQMAVIEAARSLAGIEKAGSTEFGPTPEPVVGLMTEWLRGNELEKRSKAGDLGGTMRLGAYAAELKPGSQIAQIYGTTSISERHRHRYEVNMGYRDRLAKMRPDFLGHVAGWPAAGDGGVCRPSLVHRRAISPRAEVAPLRAASAFRQFYRGRGRAIAARLSPPLNLVRDRGRTP